MPVQKGYNLSSEELKHRDQPKYLKLLSLSFEYLLAGVLKKYGEIHGVTTIEKFNNNNRIMPPLLASYPFFIALSNGHSKSLYNLFGEFYPLSFGPVSKPIWELMASKNPDESPATRPLKYIKAQSITITIDSRFKSFDDLAETLKKETISEFSDAPVEFEDFFIQNNDEKYTTALFCAIDNGIQIVTDKTNKLFDGSLKRVRDLSVYYNGSLDNYESSNSEIEYSSIESPRRRVIYSNRPVHS